MVKNGLVYFDTRETYYTLKDMRYKYNLPDSVLKELIEGTGMTQEESGHWSYKGELVGIGQGVIDPLLRFLDKEHNKTNPIETVDEVLIEKRLPFNLLEEEIDESKGRKVN